MLRIIVTALVGALLAGWPIPSWAGEASCVHFPDGSLSKMECEWITTRIRRTEGERTQTVPQESQMRDAQIRIPESAPPRLGEKDWDREAGRRICGAYRVTGNEWTNCVTFHEQNPPCSPPPDARWETCVRGIAREAQRKVEEARRQAAERRRQAELEERRVRALEESAQAQRDQARAQEGIAWGLNRPPACTTVLIAPGVVRTVCP